MRERRDSDIEMDRNSVKIYPVMEEEKRERERGRGGLFKGFDCS